MPISVGEFNLDQGNHGRISEISVWDYEMTSDEIRVLSCEDVGNLVNSSSLQIAGGIDYYEKVTLMRDTGITGKF